MRTLTSVPEIIPFCKIVTVFKGPCFVLYICSGCCEIEFPHSSNFKFFQWCEVFKCPEQVNGSSPAPPYIYLVFEELVLLMMLSKTRFEFLISSGVHFLKKFDTD